MAKIRLEKMRIPLGIPEERKLEYIEEYINNLESELEYILTNISDENMNISDFGGGVDSVSDTYK